MMRRIKTKALSFGKAVFSRLAVMKPHSALFQKRVLRDLQNVFKGETAIDARRRAFLKYAAFGTAVFLAGKYLNPFINLLRGDTVLSEKTFENFKITETGRKLLVTDDEGDEILTIDKESF